MLGGVLLSGVATQAADAPPLSDQLTELGRQALDQGAPSLAQTFYERAIRLDPANEAASRGLDEAKTLVERLARQDTPQPADAQAEEMPVEEEPAETPVPPPVGEPAPEATTPREAKATLEETEAAESLAREQLTNDVTQRLTAAHNLLSSGQPEAALNALRLAQNVVRSANNVSEEVRKSLDNRIQAQIQSTLRAEDRIISERVEAQRLQTAEEQRDRAVQVFEQNKQTIRQMMIQFDTLMSEGIYNVLYNGGTGNIAAATAPFYQARLLAQQARALMRKGTLPYSDTDPAPYAGMAVSSYMGFLSQELQFEALKEYRYMLTMQDVARASVPFPDDSIIEYPDAERWRALSERRIRRYGKAVDLFERDAKTRKIIEKLDEPISMSFANETPLEDVLKYIKTATADPGYSGIPIYVDPIGLQEEDRTMTSTVTIDLEGVPLKTTLKLLLKQIGLAYTVKDGFVMITSIDSEDQQTEIRVYPVADLAIIPFSLMGMGGGMGGMGGGMMGGMGGMGGGMGGMGGMMSVPVSAPQDAPSSFLEKKSN
jgi:tetratricopeptide (TPR) repeat protein